MNKTTISSIVLTVFLTLSISKTKAQAVKEGDNIVEGYYGFLSISSAVFRAISTNSESTFKTFGPMGIRFEHMVSDKIGIGVDANIHNLSLNWVDGGDSYEISRNSFRVMPRINLHFGQSEKFDGYFGVGAGYLSRKWDVKTTDEDFDDTFSSTNLLPATMRLALGGRYFFTESIGLNMEFGLGGGTLIHGGLSFKF